MTKYQLETKKLKKSNFKPLKTQTFLSIKERIGITSHQPSRDQAILNNS